MSFSSSSSPPSGKRGTARDQKMTDSGEEGQCTGVANESPILRASENGWLVRGSIEKTGNQSFSPSADSEP